MQAIGLPVKPGMIQPELLAPFFIVQFGLRCELAEHPVEIDADRTRSLHRQEVCGERLFQSLPDIGPASANAPQVEPQPTPAVIARQNLAQSSLGRLG